jgi:hypothetical protein
VKEKLPAEIDLEHPPILLLPHLTLRLIAEFGNAILYFGGFRDSGSGTAALTFEDKKVNVSLELLNT